MSIIQLLVLRGFWLLFWLFGAEGIVMMVRADSKKGKSYFIIIIDMCSLVHITQCPVNTVVL